MAASVYSGDRLQRFWCERSLFFDGVAVKTPRGLTVCEKLICRLIWFCFYVVRAYFHFVVVLLLFMAGRQTNVGLMVDQRDGWSSTTTTLVQRHVFAGMYPRSGILVQVTIYRRLQIRRPIRSLRYILTCTRIRAQCNTSENMMWRILITCKTILSLLTYRSLFIWMYLRRINLRR